MKRYLKVALLWGIIIFLFVWFVSLLKCEILTYKYGSQFEDLYKGHVMIDDVDCIKVLKYSENSATVYYISKNHRTGELVKYKKQDGKWEFHSWSTIWSTSGSADGYIWPYIR